MMMSKARVVARGPVRGKPKVQDGPSTEFARMMCPRILETVQAAGKPQESPQTPEAPPEEPSVQG